MIEEEVDEEEEEDIDVLEQDIDADYDSFDPLKLDALDKIENGVNEVEAGAVSQLIGGLSQLNQASAGSAKVNARLAQAQALIDTYAGANKALASAPPPFNFVLAGSVIAAGLANVLTISRSMGDLKAFATGGDFVTSGPQMIMVGDNPGGRERVQVTPLSSPNINGPQGINVNIQGNIIGTQEFVRDSLIPEINNTIQNNLA